MEGVYPRDVDTCGDALVASVRHTLAAHADPVRAAGQRAYMKSELPYQGITMTTLRPLLRPLMADHRLATRDEWEGVIHALWDDATYREEWYAALAIARHRYYASWRLETESLNLYEHLVRTGQWWDVCDEIAQHLLSPLLGAQRVVLEPVMRQWSRDADLWIRRVAVQSQLALKADTDPQLLADLIEPNLGDPTFWMRKAIGWSLREYSKVDPDWVRGFVAAHEGSMAGLSRREALRLITP